MWEIGCGSATGHPIVLLPCVELLKRLYYEVQVVFWWWIVPVLCWKAQKLDLRSAKIQPSEAKFDPSEVDTVFPEEFW